MTIYDTILWLESRPTGRRFPTVQFSADTDMVTAGWVSMTSISRHEIVLTQLTAEESQATTREPSAYVQVENRVNAILGRDDLRVPWLVRIEERGPQADGLSFQESLKVYRPPRLLYRDILALDSLSEEISRVSREEFESSGGRLVVL
jgi:hypothetical protein